MKRALLLFFITTSLFAQQRVRAGGGPQIPADWPAPEPPAQRTDEALVTAIGAYGEKLAAAGHFSGVLLVAKNGKPMLERAWGIANEKERNTPATRFNIGSINKSFTRLAIEQLAAAGRLSLDDTVRKHLPDFPSPEADRITIRQLLEHRSGLGDIFGPKYDAAPPSKLRELADFVPLFADAPLQFEPGTSQRYSNAGYIVLGLIVEKISGQKYRDYVKAQIFDPAGMKDTGFFAVDENAPRIAKGWLAEGVTNTKSLPGRPSSAGGAFATAADMLRYANWSKIQGMVAGGTPGANAVMGNEDPWTVVALSNISPPSAEALGIAAMDMLGGGEEPRLVRRQGPPTPDEVSLKGPVAVPLHDVNHMVAVDAMVNGKGPYRFVIDTGFGGNLRLSDELAREIGAPKIGEGRSGDPSGKNLQTVSLVRVESLKIAGAEFGGIEATTGARENIIGLPLFDVMTVTLDYPKHELRLSLAGLPEGGANTIAFSRPRGIPEIDLLAGGKAIHADVDSGSPALLSVPPSFGLEFEGEPQVVGRGRTVNNEFDIRAAKLRGDLVVAGMSQPGPMVDIVEHFPVANIGSRFLRQCAVTFDLRNERMSLAR